MIRRWNGPVVCTIDMLVSLVAAFIALAILIEDPKQTKAADEKPPGVVTIQIFWPDNLNADIDLWVRAPGDRAVGYSNKDGAVFSLLRDDLGFVNDTSGRNFEVAYSRTTPPGEYVVNAHAYTVRGSPLPIAVRLVVQQRLPGASTVTLIEQEASLEREGEEITIARFRLDEKGNLVPGSINNLPLPLRSAS